MIEREVAQINVSELSRAKMFAELTEGHENDVAELAIIVSRFGDGFRVSRDRDKATRPSCGGGPTLCDEFHVAGKACLLEELTPCGVFDILSWFDQSAGQLVENSAWSRPVLPGENDVAGRCDRKDGDRVLVTEDVPFGVTAVREPIPTRHDAQVAGGARSLIHEIPLSDHV
jgi:hypothetical protein